MRFVRQGVAPFGCKHVQKMHNMGEVSNPKTFRAAYHGLKLKERFNNDPDY